MTETTNYGLKKPAEGSSGWADNVNGNFDAIDSKMKANEGIGDALSEHLSGTPSKHTAEQIDSQTADALGVQDGLDGLLRDIVGTTNPNEFTRNLNHLRLHLLNGGHWANSITCAFAQWGASDVNTALDKIFNKHPYMYSFRHIADSASVDILESVLKAYASLDSSLSGSVSTELAIQILKDEGDFYVQENTISTKIYKQLEPYVAVTKEHLDKINISGLTVGSTYKIIVWFKRIDASGPEDPL